MSESPDSIYLDNASTSWPKSLLVQERVLDYMTHCGAAYGRSSGRAVAQVRQTIEELRFRLAQMFGAKPSEIIFTSSATDALNLAIQGLLIQRCMFRKTECGTGSAEVPLVIASEIEHNSVLRPINAWEKQGLLRVRYLPCDECGRLNFEELDYWLAQEPWLVCLNHASNVTGTIQDLHTVGRKCRQVAALFLVDAAQTAGYLPVNVQNLSCDLLVTSGHKGLGGPLGTGILYLRSEIQDQVHSLRLGGTGSASSDLEENLTSPTKWEAGNLNVPGLVGLAAALESQGADGLAIQASQSYRLTEARQRCTELWQGLTDLPGIRRIGNQEPSPFSGPDARLPIISLVASAWQPTELAIALDFAGGFVTRAGFHCAPLIHSRLGTDNSGTLRISPSVSTSTEEIIKLLTTLEAVCQM